MRPPLPAAFLRVPLAHRAYHDRSQRRPENSPGAVKAAIAAGYGIEIDLQLSSDGVAMVFHDDALDRLTDATGLVRDHTAAALSQIKLRDSDDSIPTLPEILTLIAARAAIANAQQQVPSSLSDFPGGRAGATSRMEALDALSPAALADALEALPQAQRDLYLSRQM